MKLLPSFRLLATVVVFAVLMTACDSYTVMYGTPLGVDDFADPDGLNCQDMAYNKDGASIEVVKLDDARCYPAVQFQQVYNEEGCPQDHYHLTLFSLGGFVRPDEQPCGAALASQMVRRGYVFVDPSAIDEYNELLKNHYGPSYDWDGNGVRDDQEEAAYQNVLGEFGLSTSSAEPQE